VLNENTAKGLLIKPYVTNRHLRRTNFIVLYVQCSREDIPLAYNTCVAESMTMGEVVKVKTDRKWGQPTHGAGKIRASTDARRSLILMPNSCA